MCCVVSAVLHVVFMVSCMCFVYTIWRLLGYMFSCRFVYVFALLYYSLIVVVVVCVCCVSCVFAHVCVYVCLFYSVFVFAWLYVEISNCVYLRFVCFKGFACVAWFRCVCCVICVFADVLVCVVC